MRRLLTTSTNSRGASNTRATFSSAMLTKRSGSRKAAPMRSYPCTCGRPISCHTRTDVPSGRSVGIAPWMRVVWSRLTMLVRERSPLVRQVVYGYLAEIRYSPPRLHATLRTGARCPVIAPTSVHSPSCFLRRLRAVGSAISANRRSNPMQEHRIRLAPKALLQSHRGAVRRYRQSVVG